MGRGRASAQDVRDALVAERPAFDGDAAAAHGLTLWRVPMGPARDGMEDYETKHTDNDKRD